ncbi:hypothetical protein KYB31_07865 [Clostridium felsineum]|uniref:hypothetical protein n=1 Tax=Clostridium felsineum TaxID=36839 RepID=UPI00214DA7B4|nr:hypothetical protein [Clostridium felsineum]MCR3758905.1 hypothetical protein [Clostridium felsineum]
MIKINAEPILLTFSKKNQDVYKILKEVCKNGVKQTEYICEAVRFYFKNKDEMSIGSSVDKSEIKDLVFKYIAMYAEGKENEQIKAPSVLYTSSLTAKDLEDD